MKLFPVSFLALVAVPCLLLPTPAQGDTWSLLSYFFENNVEIFNLFRQNAHHVKVVDNNDENVPRSVGRGINGGFTCAGCTIAMAVTKQLTQIYNETAEESLMRMCTYLPVKYDESCKYLIGFLGPILFKLLKEDTSPDTICYNIRLCNVQQNKTMCHLFPLPAHLNEIESLDKKPVEIPKEYLEKSRAGVLPWICSIPGVSELCQAVMDVYGKLTPALDHDDDKFSPTELLRGSIWRGRDCNDLTPHIYPGRKPADNDRESDSNCNGIYGVNPETGLSYEEELCGDSGQRGVIFIGDSVGAHFHFPPTWLTPAKLTSGIFQNMSYVISNESDWPDLSFSTGFRNSTMPDLIQGQTDSIYLRLRERNLCNHRDYQNLARNGANSNSTDDYMISLARDRLLDQPAIVFYSLIGNDVCNEFLDTVAHMSKPADFYDNNMKTLRFLEKHLPAESHVLLIGLVDGRVMFDSMAHRVHPLGLLNQDLRYTDMYRWMNCMEMGPCHGWQTSNATLRIETTKHARQLTKVLKDIARKEKFATFDIHFMPNPFRAAIKEWVKNGGEAWQLIEPVDSLHPTQVAQSLITRVTWELLEKTLPDVLGPVNTRNGKIRELFGDQNGH